MRQWSAPEACRSLRRWTPAGRLSITGQAPFLSDHSGRPPRKRLGRVHPLRRPLETRHPFNPPPPNKVLAGPSSRPAPRSALCTPGQPTGLWASARLCPRPLLSRPGVQGKATRRARASLGAGRRCPGTCVAWRLSSRSLGRGSGTRRAMPRLPPLRLRSGPASPEGGAGRVAPRGARTGPAAGVGPADTGQGGCGGAALGRVPFEGRRDLGPARRRQLRGRKAAPGATSPRPLLPRPGRAGAPPAGRVGGAHGPPRPARALPSPRGRRAGAGPGRARSAPAAASPRRRRRRRLGPAGSDARARAARQPGHVTPRGAQSLGEGRQRRGSAHVY